MPGAPVVPALEPVRMIGKWKPLVLFFLRNGPKRYGELKRLIPGVSDKVLIQQLKDLEADRVLARTDYKEVPPRVDYALTPLGCSLAEAIIPLCTWGTEHAAEMASIFAERDALPTPGPQESLDRQTA
jgi:DNA-binding HxlR family transcriptional regulator